MEATPTASTGGGGVIFLRAAENHPDQVLISIQHQHSIALRDLPEDLNVSSVLECDANGNVQPRAVAFDSPSDVLHSGKYYIARRDAQLDEGGNRVTFRGKIEVKEYQLDNTVTPAVKAADASTSASSVVTPSGDNTPQCCSTANGMDKENCVLTFTTARALHLSATTDRKRPREVVDDDGVLSARALGDITNCTNAVLADCGAPRRYIPFEADLHGTGQPQLVTLQDLAVLCRSEEQDARVAEEKHRNALSVLENARRVLFAATQ